MSKVALLTVVLSFVTLVASLAIAAGMLSDLDGDTRWAVYGACSLVFVAIAIYLVMTHKTGARLNEDIEHLERRIDSLEG